MPEIANQVPRVSLPLKLHVVKHPKEVEGKSTAVHAAVIANKDTTVHTWPDIPNFDPAKTLLVFPCDESVTLEQLAKEVGEEAEKGGVEKESSTATTTASSSSSSSDSSSLNEPPKKKIRLSALRYDSVVFIESTWNQAHSIFIDERLQKLRRIQLSDYETHFWRYQRGKPTTFLSTIEAIYWFYVEFDQHFGESLPSSSPSFTPSFSSSSSSTTKQFDNLLFFFSYMHSKIFKMYDGKLKVTEERRQRLAERQKEEAKARKEAEAEKEEGESNGEGEKEESEKERTVKDDAARGGDATSEPHAAVTAEVTTAVHAS